MFRHSESAMEDKPDVPDNRIFGISVARPDGGDASKLRAATLLFRQLRPHGACGHEL